MTHFLSALFLANSKHVQKWKLNEVSCKIASFRKETLVRNASSQCFCCCYCIGWYSWFSPKNGKIVVLTFVKSVQNLLAFQKKKMPGKLLGNQPFLTIFSKICSKIPTNVPQNWLFCLQICLENPAKFDFFCHHLSETLDGAETSSSGVLASHLHDGQRPSCLLTY